MCPEIDWLQYVDRSVGEPWNILFVHSCRLWDCGTVLDAFLHGLWSGLYPYIYSSWARMHAKFCWTSTIQLLWNVDTRLGVGSWGVIIWYPECWTPGLGWIISVWEFILFQKCYSFTYSLFQVLPGVPPLPHLYSFWIVEFWIELYFCFWY